MISKTKVNESFPFGNFLLLRFSILHRSDCDSKGGWMLFYVGEDIPSNLSTREKKLIKGFFKSS